MPNATATMTTRTSKPSNPRWALWSIAIGLLATIAAVVAPPLIAVPNTFTPNGDGHNDRFTYLIEGGIRRVLEFRIFNRWGQLVFDAKTSDPNGLPGWDGAFKGRPQPSEVYFFLIRLERYDGGVEARQGEVSLLR